MSFTLLSEHTRKAAKNHRCIWCPELIAAGSTYVDERSMYDSGIQHHKFHPECRDACGRVAIQEGGECEIFPHESKRGSEEGI